MSATHGLGLGLVDDVWSRSVWQRQLATLPCLLRAARADSTEKRLAQQWLEEDDMKPKEAPRSYCWQLLPALTSGSYHRQLLLEVSSGSFFGHFL